MYEKIFKKLFWGYLFTVINFRIMGIDILPDTIGYIIILLGLKALVDENEYFKKAINYNYGMIITSIFEIYKVSDRGVLLGMQRQGPINIIVGIAGTIISICFMYNLFMAVKELCYNNHIIDLGNETDELWGLYWKLLVGLLLAIPFAFIPVLGIIYVVILLIMLIVLNVRILKLFWECSKRFSDDRVLS